MKTWYLLVVLAVIFIFAVCRFDTIETVFCENRFLGEITTSGGCDFSEYRLILHPEHTESIHEHPDFQNQSTSASPDPFSVKNQSGIIFVFFLFGFIIFPYVGPYCCSINSVNSICQTRTCILKSTRWQDARSHYNCWKQSLALTITFELVLLTESIKQQ